MTITPKKSKIENYVNAQTLGVWSDNIDVYFGCCVVYITVEVKN
jgi:hypothetical protein